MEIKTNKKGFTLIELVIVVGIIGIIVGIGGDMFATVMRAYQKAESFSTVERTGNQILTQIEQHLRSATKVVTTDNSVTLTIPTAGGTNETHTYTFLGCAAGNDNEVNYQPPSSGSFNLLLQDSDNFFNESLYISPIGSAFITRHEKPGASYDMVTIAFEVKTGNCNSNQANVVSQFQTTVNLRGGIQ